MCASGQRAAVGASLVARDGGTTVLHITPLGVPAWGRAGHPLDAGR